MLYIYIYKSRVESGQYLDHMDHMGYTPNIYIYILGV